MKTIVFCILCVLIFPALLFTQGKENSFGVGIELQTGYGMVLNNGFRDERPRFGIAAEWLNEINHGFILSPRLNVYIPFGIRFYGGYHYSSFPERSVNAEFWTNIYMQDMENHFEKDSHKISNTSRGFVAGMSYAPPYLRYLIQPYVFWEVRSERLKATTRLSGRAENWWSIFGPRSGDMEGRSVMKTDRVSGTAYGFGFEVPWGSFIIVPEWRYISVTAPIVDRTVEDSIFLVGGNGTSYRTSRLDILDEQTIDIQYHSIHLGVRYNIPASKFTSQIFLPNGKENLFALAIELQAGWGIPVGDSYSDRMRAGGPRGPGDWLTEINRGNLFTGKVIGYAPYGFRLYGGYHYNTYPGKDAGTQLWTSIYHKNFLHRFEANDYLISNTSRGFLGGIAYGLPEVQSSFQPYVFFELHSQRFRSKTELTGRAEDFYSGPHGPMTGAFEGHSILRTERALGTAYGIGFEIPLWRIIIVPEWKYHSAKSPIDKRLYEYTISQDDGSSTTIETDFEIFIADGEWKIDMRYHALQVGIRYLIF